MKKHTTLHANLRYQDKDGRGYGEQIFVNDRAKLMYLAFEVAKSRAKSGCKNIEVKLVIMHYNEMSFNVRTDYELYSYDGEKLVLTEKIKGKACL